MPTAAFICIALLFIVYFVHKNYKELKSQVTRCDRMRLRYPTLVKHLTAYPSAKITRQTDNSLEIEAPFSICRIHRSHDLTLCEAQMRDPLSGKTFSRRWIYPADFPQEEILGDIRRFLEGATAAADSEHTAER